MRAEPKTEERRLSPQWGTLAGKRLVSRLSDRLRRTERGLDASLTPRLVSPPSGECAGVAVRETSKPETKTGTTEVKFHADMGSFFGFRCVSWNGRMLLSVLLASDRVHSRNKVNIVPDFQSVRG